ncbi:hypothetical protein ASR47_100379 [Janthinobacterium psychrotolerans]|uniref:Uncharacterized protein n=2 Tax=Janthinobacterium psychrotolerans TaxID=1747903 RepID=A0A1A7BXF2_9BURK|nr:hypothetical protein ASR47_100379 [Janthinobacterium psychrotolerans]
MQYMDKLTVVLVEPPGDEAASVTLRSATGEVVAFCWPCDLHAGDRIDNRLSTLEADVRASYCSDWPEDEREALSTEWIERTGPHAYRGRGRVVDQAQGLVEVNGFIIEMNVPGGAYVDFSITRLDVGR